MIIMLARNLIIYNCKTNKLQMKFTIALIFSLQCLLFTAQTNINTLVKNDLNTGNIKDLSSYFTDNIDISINDIDAIYSRSQAEMVLKKFFTNNKVIQYKTEHAGNSSADNQYIIGKMNTENGTYRVTYFVTTENNQLKIKQFNIESY